MTKLNLDKDRGPFGNFLHRELKERQQQTVKWLTNQINYSSDKKISESTIRHWLSGNRVPAENHKLLPKLAEALNIALKDIRKEINESHTWKASNPRTQKSFEKKRSSLLFQPPEFKELPDLKDLSRNLKEGENSIAIVGENNVLETAISRIQKLPKAKDGEQLFIMIQGKMSTISKLDKKLRYIWNKSIGEALEKGWKVTHIIRINNDLERIKKMVEGFLIIVGHEGNYSPKSFKQKYVLPVAQSFILAPSIGEGLALYAGKQQPEHVDSAIFIRDQEQIDILTNHFILMMEDMNPLFSIYDNYSSVSSDLLQADRKPGNRIVILQRISDIQRPDRFYQKNSKWANCYKESHDLSDQELEEILQNRLQRKNNLKECSINHSCRYIYTDNCIKKLINFGEEKALNYNSPKEDRVDQLKEFRDLLEYPNFEIALSEEDISLSLDHQEKTVKATDLDRIIPDFCEVQQDELVVMQYSSKKKSGSGFNNKWIVIKEPIIVRAIYEHLLEIWNEINEVRRGKYYISKWVKEEIHSLEKDANK